MRATVYNSSALTYTAACSNDFTRHVAQEVTSTRRAASENTEGFGSLGGAAVLSGADPPALTGPSTLAYGDFFRSKSGRIPCVAAQDDVCLEAPLL